MKITFYGTRGSMAISNAMSFGYGGNTTCLRIESECFAPGLWVGIDGGTGLLPFSTEFFKNGGKRVFMLHTHYHHDHAMGWCMAGFAHAKHIPVTIAGPFDRGVGPAEMLAYWFKKPLFPVPYEAVASHFELKPLENPATVVILFHPKSPEAAFISLSEFECRKAKGLQMPFTNDLYALEECLEVRMHMNRHPDQTVSYRLVEHPTGKVFVFATDHENDGFPQSLLGHMSGANLLVVDCQYTAEMYQRTAGFGHSTPEYVGELIKLVQPRALGITHHDPGSSDEAIEQMVERVRFACFVSTGENPRIPIFACRDYLAVTVGEIEG